MAGGPEGGEGEAPGGPPPWIDESMQQAYAALKAPENWRQIAFDCGHQETAAMRTHVLNRLRRVVA